MKKNIIVAVMLLAGIIKVQASEQVCVVSNKPINGHVLFSAQPINKLPVSQPKPLSKEEEAEKLVLSDGTLNRDAIRKLNDVTINSLYILQLPTIINIAYEILFYNTECSPACKAELIEQILWKNGDLTRPRKSDDLDSEHDRDILHFLWTLHGSSKHHKTNFFPYPTVDLLGPNPLLLHHVLLGHKIPFRDLVVRKLIDCGADINAQDLLGRTALHYAVIRGYKQIVQFLIESGADSSLKDRAPLVAQSEKLVMQAEGYLSKGSIDAKALCERHEALQKTPRDYALEFDRDKVLAILDQNKENAS